MSSRSIQQLAAILASEEGLYRELLEVLQQERELMVDLDAEAIGAVARKKETIATEGRLMEQGRREVAARLAAELGITTDPPTLSQICERLGDDAGPLRAAHSRLVAVVGAVRELVEANRIIGGERLGFVQNTLSLLGRLLPGHVEQGFTYERSGNVPEPEVPGGRLVSRSA